MLKKIIYIALIFSTLSANAQVTAGFTTNKTGTNFCLNDTIVFTNTSTGNFVISYWDFGDNVDTWADNPKHVYQKTGQFTVTLTVTDSANNSNSTTLGITVNDIPTISIINNSAMQTLTANVNDSTVAYQWLYNTDTTTETGSLIYYLESGKYTAIATNSSGCSASAFYNVNLAQDSANIDSNQIIVLNNILTPDLKDGANDVLFVQGLSNFSSPCILAVYNKWGQLVYLNQNYTNLGGFEGLDNKGKKLDSSTYMYIIKSSGKKTTSGYIDLIR